jgi:hypothetical protein
MLALAAWASVSLTATPLWAQSEEDGDEGHEHAVGEAQPPQPDRQDADDGGARADGGDEEQAASDPHSEPGAVELGGEAAPSSPVERLQRAERAFDNADYDILRPLLEPVLVPDSEFRDRQQRRRARTLLSVGLYFEAQQVTDASQRRELLSAVQAQFLEILRDEPDFELNPLIFPASIVEQFEEVKEEHAEELEEIRLARASSQADQRDQGLQTIYIERQVDQRSLALNFFPFGVGQFQNRQPVKGAFFGSAQALALGANMAGYWMVESLRGPDGYYEAGSATQSARQWQTTQYIGLGVFAGLYAWSVIDALVTYEGADVRIHTLDGPPPEMNTGGADDKGATFQIGWGGFGFSW